MIGHSQTDETIKIGTNAEQREFPVMILGIFVLAIVLFVFSVLFVIRW
jgi:hypothetical protein